MFWRNSEDAVVCWSSPTMLHISDVSPPNETSPSSAVRVNTLRGALGYWMADFGMEA